METSAKTGLNTELLFVKAAKLLYTDYIKYNVGNPLKGKKNEINNNNNIKVKKGSKRHKKKHSFC